MPNQSNAVSISSPKIAALFGDCNFIRICGHVIVAIIISSITVFLLYLSKYLPDTKQSHSDKEHEINISLASIKRSLTRKFKLIKWSHIHDFITVFTMIVTFGFWTQTSDYSSSSTIQIVGILFSWVLIAAIVVYYSFMGRKLYLMIQLSQKDPQRFSEKHYLFR